VRENVVKGFRERARCLQAVITIGHISDHAPDHATSGKTTRQSPDCVDHIIYVGKGFHYLTLKLLNTGGSLHVNIGKVLLHLILNAGNGDTCLTFEFVNVFFCLSFEVGNHPC
jgi:hypothetical protein